jgi:hypothetical protein
VTRFASEAQARRNRDRSEQREWWRDASQHLLGSLSMMPPRFTCTGMSALTRRASCRSSRVIATTLRMAGLFAQEPPAAADEPVLERLSNLMTNARCFELLDPQLLSPSDVHIY